MNVLRKIPGALLLLLAIAARAANPITFLASPASITITDDGTWHTYDVSGSCSASDSGVLLRSRFSAASSSDNFAARKTGSTDNYVAAHLASPVYQYTAIGIDGSRQVDILAEDGGAGAVSVDVMACFNSSHVVFFANAITVDGSEILQVLNASSAYGDWKIVGYTKGPGYTTVSPAADVSLGATGAYTDITQTGCLAQVI